MVLRVEDVGSRGCGLALGSHGSRVGRLPDGPFDPLIYWFDSVCVSERPNIVHDRQQTINGSLSNVLRKPAGEDESMEMAEGSCLDF